MMDSMISFVGRVAGRTGSFSSFADRLLETLVPSTSARAGFAWLRKCRNDVLILSCPPSGCGDHRWCDVLCEFTGSGVECYWSTAKNCSYGCGPCGTYC